MDQLELHNEAILALDDATVELRNANKERKKLPEIYLDMHIACAQNNVTNHPITVPEFLRELFKHPLNENQLKAADKCASDLMEAIHPGYDKKFNIHFADQKNKKNLSVREEKRKGNLIRQDREESEKIGVANSKNGKKVEVPYNEFVLGTIQERLDQAHIVLTPKQFEPIRTFCNALVTPSDERFASMRIKAISLLNELFNNADAEQVKKGMLIPHHVIRICVGVLATNSLLSRDSMAQWMRTLDFVEK